MIFQNEFDDLRFFSNNQTVVLNSPKTTVLSREERLKMRKEEMRRKKIQEIRSGIKRFAAMIFSHIGLSSLVIAYTIIGAMLFGGIELFREEQIKLLASQHKDLASIEVLQLAFKELQNGLTLQRIINNETSRFINYMLSYLDYSHEKVTKNLRTIELKIWNNTEREISNETSAEFDPIEENNNMTEAEFLKYKHERYMKLQFIRHLHSQINFTLENFTNQIMDLIENEGWNGKYPMEDIKWSFAGSVLYAITVITTIGYGHATPKTNLGKFLTILYALFGMPLMFLYLSNVGDYLADLFRTLYSRTCRPTCDQFCSLSIIHQLVKSTFLNRQKNKPGHLNSNEHLIEHDMHNNLHHGYARRRHRVLLKPMYPTDSQIQLNNPDNEDGEEEKKIKMNDEKNNVEDKLKNENIEIHFIFIKKILKQKAVRQSWLVLKNNANQLKHYLLQTRLVRLAQSEQVQRVQKDVEARLGILFENTNKWIRETVVSLWDPTASLSETKQPNTVSTLELASLNDKNVTSCEIIQNPYACQSNEGFRSDTNLITTQVQVEPGAANDTIVNQPNLHALYDKTINTFINPSATLLPNSASCPIPTKIQTPTLPNFPMSPTLNNHTLASQLFTMPKDATQYFTYDGGHRKFYTIARYLRSFERERRHKRRVKKRLEEKTRSDKTRLENEKAYGTLKLSEHKPKMMENYKISHEHHKNQSNQSTMPADLDGRQSELETNQLMNSAYGDTNAQSYENSIPLLSWRDIDLDLEVRSIDDYTELRSLSSKGVPISTEPGSIWMSSKKNGTDLDIYSQYQHDGNMNSLSIWDQIDVKNMRNTCKTHNDDSLNGDFTNPSNFKSKGNIPFPPSPNPVPDNNDEIFLNHNRLHDSQTLPHRTQLINPQNMMSNIVDKLVQPNINQSLLLNKFNNIHAQTLPPSFSNMHTYSSNNYDLANTFNCSQNFFKSTSQYAPVDNSQINKDSSNSEDEGTPKLYRKSRLSLASSQGDLNSDVFVKLSYYSQRNSTHSEEELSFFSYRDGFTIEEDVSKITVPISLSLLMMSTYIFIGAIVFSSWEDSDYLKWSYFCFITLSTIGFGDIVPGTKIDSTNPKEKLVIISLYVAIGLSVFAMCFKLMQEEVVDKMKWFAIRTGMMKKKESQDQTDKSNHSTGPHH